jgi:hypothetical protein
MGTRSFGLGLLAVVALVGGCASDARTVTTGKVRLSADREPFTFSSWDVSRVEWSAAPNDSKDVPPNVAAVLIGGKVVPLRTLTLTLAKRTPGLKVGTPANVDDHHGNTFANATPVTGSGFKFDYVGERMVHFVAEGYDNDGSPSQPVFECVDGDRRDAFGDIKQYALPLTHDECIDLFGGAQGLETDINIPPFSP